eukprot:scaffold325340_cov48-Prasinocladus_malaysianus.AAC.1
MIETAQTLHKDVKEARASGALEPQASEPVPRAPSATIATAEPQLVVQDSFDALGLGELQDALNAPAQAAPVVDPFAQV